jgi:hypothetical protein
MGSSDRGSDAVKPPVITGRKGSIRDGRLRMDRRLAAPGQKPSATAQYWEGNSGHWRLAVCRIPIMKRTKLRPAGIVALKSKAHLVRQVALEQGVSYDETPVPGEDNAVRFSFQPMDDATSRKLIMAMPREAFARHAIIGGGPPPGIIKDSQ